MNKYEAAEMEIVRFEYADVITTSLEPEEETTRGEDED